MKITKTFVTALRSALRIAKNRYSPTMRCVLIERHRIRGVGPMDELALDLPEELAAEWPADPVAVPAKAIEAALSVSSKELVAEQATRHGIWTLNGVTVDTTAGIAQFRESAAAFQGPSTVDRATLFTFELEAQFYDGLQRVSPARAVDDIRQHLQGMLLDLGRRRLVATDGSRLHCAEGALPVARPLKEPQEGVELLTSFICGASALTELQALRPGRLTIHDGKARLARNLEDEPPVLTFEPAQNSGTTWRLTSRCLGGVFPDMDRVVNALPVETQQAFQLRERAKPGSHVKASFPVSVRLPDYSEALDQYIKATLKTSRMQAPLVVLDLRKGNMRSVDNAPVAFSQPIFPLGVTPEIQQVLEDDSQALCAVQAPFLRDAMRALGEPRTWTVSALGTWQSERDRAVKVLVMPRRL